MVLGPNQGHVIGGGQQHEVSITRRFYSASKRNVSQCQIGRLLMLWLLTGPYLAPLCPGQGMHQWQGCRMPPLPLYLQAEHTLCARAGNHGEAHVIIQVELLIFELSRHAGLTDALIMQLSPLLESPNFRNLIYLSAGAERIIKAFMCNKSLECSMQEPLLLPKYVRSLAIEEKCTICFLHMKKLLI